MKIPFVDLKKHHAKIKKEIQKAINSVVETNAYIMGPELKKFELDFAKFCNVKYSVGVNSGSSGLFLALKALGVKQGDEVITVANTFIATAQAISMCGAKIKFVDVDEKTCLMDAKKLERAITKKTKVILPVHLYGQICDMKLIMKIAKKYGVKVLEDACESHGAKQNGKKQIFGDLVVYSFYPSKNLGAFGDAGAVVTNNLKLYEKVLALRDYGRKKGAEYLHEEEGFNMRMDSLQAAVLNVKLKYLNKWNSQRRNHVKLYNKFLKDLVIIPSEEKNNDHVYYVYVIQVNKRAELMKFLSSKGVGVKIHFPIPIYSQPQYTCLKVNKKSFSNTEKISKKILSLPMFPELTDKQIKYVCQQINNFYSKNS